jgi:hypothetical protein
VARERISRTAQEGSAPTRGKPTPTRRRARRPSLPSVSVPSEERPFCDASSEMLDAFALGQNGVFSSRNRSRISADCIVKCVFAFAPRGPKPRGERKDRETCAAEKSSRRQARPRRTAWTVADPVQRSSSDACAQRHQKTVSCDTDGSGATGPSSNGRLHLTAGKQKGSEDD